MNRIGKLCCVVSVYCAAGALAADSLWSGAGSDAQWSTADNWGGTALLAGDKLFFGGASKLANSNDFEVGTAFSGITFNSGSGAFVLSGNGVVLDGDVLNADGDLQTIGMPLNLSAMRTFNASNGAISVTGLIDGPGGLSKTGTRQLTLSASNAYEGVTAVMAGTVALNNSYALGSTAQGTVVDPGAKVEIYGDLTVAEPITLVNYNPGTLYFMSGSSTYSGLITITGGQARISSQAPYAHIVGGITSINSEVILSGSSFLKVSEKPILAGTRKLFSHNGGTTIIGVAGNVFGTFEAAGGTVLLEVPNAWPPTLQLEVGVSYNRNCRIDLQGNDQTVGTLTGPITNDGVRVITSSTGPATLTVNQGSATEYNSNFAGELRLVKLGAGQLTVSGTNCQQSGQTVIGGGKLNVRSEQTLGVAPASFVADQLTISNGATLLASGPCVLDDSTRGITLGTGNGTFETATGADMIVSNAITGVGGLTKAGSGILTLAGVNDYAGKTTVNGGVLQVGKKTALYNGAELSSDNFTVNSGAALSLNVGGTGEFVSGDVSVIAALGTATTGFKPGSWLALNPDNAAGAAYAISDVLGNPSGGHGLNLQKRGMGTLALTGMNTYTGATKISQGILSINTITNGGLSSAMGQSSSHRSSLVFDGGVLRYTGASTRTDRGFSYVAATNTYAFDVTQPSTVLNFGTIANSVFDGSSTTIMKTGPGTLVFGKGPGSTYNFPVKSIFVMEGAFRTEAASTIQHNLHSLVSQGQGPALVLGDGAELGFNNPLESYVNNAEMMTQYVGTQRCARITAGELTLCGPNTNSLGVLEYNTHIFEINDGQDEVDLDITSKLGIYRSNANSYVRKTGAGTLRLNNGTSTYRGTTLIRSGRLVVTGNVPKGSVSVLGSCTNDVVIGDTGSQPSDSPTFLFEGPANSAFTFARGIATWSTTGTSTFGSLSNVNITLSGPVAVSNTLQLLSMTTGTNALFVTGGIMGEGGVSAIGTGAVIFVAANTYVGTTTIAAGTLKLAASERIGNTSPLRLTGGTLNLNGFSETAGTLDVDGDAAIDFGNGSSMLTLADSSAQAWNGSLVLRNWTLGADHLFVGDSASLSAAQLAKITSPTGQHVAQLATGEVVLLPLGTLILAR